MVFRFLAKLERARIAPKLKAAGLFLEDTYYPRPIVQRALAELPADILKDRQRRLWRAADLDLKHEDLPTELQDFDPFVSYGLDAKIKEIQALEDEKNAFN